MQGAAHIMITLDIAIKGYEVKRLRNSFKKFMADILISFGSRRSVKDMVADSFPDQFNAVVQLVLSLSLFFKFYY